jgi:hypothetical protein
MIQRSIQENRKDCIIWLAYKYKVNMTQERFFKKNKLFSGKLAETKKSVLKLFWLEKYVKRSVS